MSLTFPAICVSIGRTRSKMMRAEHENLARHGARFVELRLDWLKAPPDVGYFLKDRATPVVITCRRRKDLGKWRGTEEERLALLRTAIVGGADYVDLEDDIAKSIPRYGKTRRIVSHHNFCETPPNLEAIYNQLKECDADVIKLVTMANTPSDSVRMLKLVSQADVPMVGFCMGEFGLTSRVLCGKYGSPFTYASFSSERELAPGQLSFQQMRDLYRFESINPQTRVFGVLGDPIGHSLSPQIHNAAFRAEGFDAVYLPFRAPRDHLNSTLKAFRQIDIEGYSVTIPHKQAVLPFARHQDEAVKESGAANTLYRDARGVWFAANTDYEAALGSLRTAMDSRDANSRLEGKRVTILGAGGVARAIGLGMIKSGAVVTITSRTKESAEGLAKSLNCNFITWKNRGVEYFDILVNCTPVGMHPNVDETPFPDNWLRDNSIVFDTIYNPERTLLIKQAEERNCLTVSGLDMFVRQAAAQYECFTKLPAPMEVMREAVRRAISPIRYEVAAESDETADNDDDKE